MSIHDNLNSELLKRVKANEEAIEGLQEGAGNPTKIATGTDLYIEDSAASPIIDLKLTGKSVQNGTPTPDAPQSIENVGDCVEMISGGYSGGNYMDNSNYICAKNKIPCSSGDVITINTENEQELTQVLFYSNGVYTSYVNGSDNVMVPTNATEFLFHIYNSNGITPDTVGKISLTINGKYVLQIVESGKNLVKPIGTSETKSGIAFTDNQDGTFTIKGTSTGNVSFNLTNATIHPITFNKGVSYTLSKNKISGSGGVITTSVYNSSGATVYDFIKDGETKTVNEEYTMRGLSVYIASGTTVDCTFSVQLEVGTVATEYEPYQEKVATILLNAPLCETDVMSNKEVARKRASVVYDGSDDESWVYDSTYNCFRISVPNGFKSPSSSKTNFLCSHYTPIPRGATWADYENWISATSSLFYVYAGETTTTADWKAKLQESPFAVEYELAEEVIEELDADSQNALNAIETFNPITHITVGSRIKPEISVEYVHKSYESIVNSLIERIGTPAAMSASDVSCEDPDTENGGENVQEVVDGLHNKISSVSASDVSCEDPDTENGGENVQEVVNGLYNKISNIKPTAAEWKEVGEIKGSGTELTLPEDWTELNIIVHNLLYRNSINIPRAIFDFERMEYISPTIPIKPSSQSVAEIRVTPTRAYINAYYEAGTANETVLANVGMIVYYK